MRWLMFFKESEARKWQKALDDAGIEVRCEAWLPPKDKLPPRFLWGTTVAPNGAEYNVYFVDGDFIRDNLDTTFGEGGHHAVYPFIPKGDIYVEPPYNEEAHDVEIVACIHEATEAAMMDADPMCSYEEAHGVATEAERKARTPHAVLNRKADAEALVEVLKTAMKAIR